MVAKLLEVHPKHRLLAILRRCQLRELDDAAIFHKDGEGVSGALERQASTTGRTKSLPMAPGPFFLSQLSSWRYTVGMGLVVTIAVLLCNIGLLIYTHFAETSPSGNALLYRGDCERQSFVNNIAHLGINVVSSLLLGASNVAMQCLVAPSRNDVDAAHRIGLSLDIGVNGFKNWQSMSSLRRYLWIVLIASTLPLHLLYNSVIFSTLSANNYLAFTAAPTFLDDAYTGALPFQPWNSSILSVFSFGDLVKELHADATSNGLIGLTTDQCQQAVETSFMTSYSEIVMIADWQSDESNASVIQTLVYNTEANNFFSFCANLIVNTSTAGATLESQNIWTTVMNGSLCAFDGAGFIKSIEFCLARPAQQLCTIELLPQVLYAVLVCNAVKVMCFAAMLMLGFQPLVTLGDAVASFLERPDQFTRGLGPVSSTHRATSKGLDIYKSQKSPRPWARTRLQWFKGASSARWISSILTFCIAWASCLTCFCYAYRPSSPSSLTATFANQLRAGFGNPVVGALAPTGTLSSILVGALAVNAPQIVLSLIYIMYNGLFTCMLVSKEWLSYARQRKSLRTSVPQGAQRSTYWLSLPYRYSIPLMIASGSLHWFMSQSLFLAQIDIYDFAGYDSSGSPIMQRSKSIVTIGWSSLGLLLLTILGAILILIVLGFGFLRYYHNEGMPIAGTSSRAISAACHPLPGRCSEHLQKIQYGVIADLRNGRGHVGFSCTEVKPLVKGGRYY